MAHPSETGPDPTFESERGRGSTPPEPGPAAESVVGRPIDEGQHQTAFQDDIETDGEEREPFNEQEAVKEGGSFDAVAPPGEQSES